MTTTYLTMTGSGRLSLRQAEELLRRLQSGGPVPTPTQALRRERDEAAMGGIRKLRSAIQEARQKEQRKDRRNGG